MIAEKIIKNFSCQHCGKENPIEIEIKHNYSNKEKKIEPELRLVYKDKKYGPIKVVKFPNQKGKCYGCMFGSAEKDEKVKNIVISFQEEDGWKTEFNYCNDCFLREKWWLKTDKSLANEEILDIIETRIKRLENFSTPSPH